MKDNLKKFSPSTWFINNRAATYVLTLVVSLFGLMKYNSMPKEQFPEIKFPQIIVQTIYPGTSPENMENLVTKPIEKEVKNITGLKKITSNSFQDYSVVIAEFNTDIEVDKAKQDVKDAVDKARTELPQNLPNEPEVKDINFAEFPIMNVNISGNYDLNRLKKYADDIKDRIEELKEVKAVNMVGALEREIQINVDLFKMQAAGLSFYDIEQAIGYENLSLTAGEVAQGNQKRILSIRNEFKSAEQIAALVVKNPYGKGIYLKDIAEVKDAFQEQKSYARMNGKNVITLNVIKAQGKNLIEASDKIQELTKEMQAKSLPKDLDIAITGDQSEATRTTVHDLINTIIIGFVLVTLILMFFMGTTNALFVAMSVPLSCALAFIALPMLGFSLNMIVLFSFLLALGIVVDDAIVVIENTHRIYDNGKVPIIKAAKLATGEVFLPVLTGTITTLMPFIPLAFWNGIIGEFMFFLPVTLIVTLIASLLVAYFINPAFAVTFMRPHGDVHGKVVFGKKDLMWLVRFVVVAIVAYAMGSVGFGNFVLFIYLFVLLQKFVLNKWIHSFQTKAWPAFQNWYTRVLVRSLKSPGITMLIAGVIFIASIVAVGLRQPKVDFFPRGEPNFVYVYLNLPVGTDQAYTNEVLMKLEDRVYKALDMDLKRGKKNDVVKSVISNVTVDAVDPTSGELGEFPNKGRITVAFVEFAKRHGVSTADLLSKIRGAIKGVPGAEVTVDKEQGGPPLPKPIVVEITGDNLDSLIATSQNLKRYLESKNIPGVEELRSDFQADKPEIVFDIDRARMNMEGISTGQVAGNLRTAVFGKEISRFRDANDDYPITLRLQEDQRGNIDAVRNMPMIYRDMGMNGAIRTVPVSAFASIDYNTTYGGIKRKDQKRIIALNSNVLLDYNPNEVVAAVTRELNGFKAPAGMSIKMSGQQEEQAETMGFLGGALLTSIVMIFLLLVMQFNSISRTIIIMTEILFSVFGVLLGIGLFGINVSIVMSGIGIVALAGIVVRNGILLVEFMDLMLAEGMSPYDAIVEAGKTRMTPVLLTATAAILGLIPLAVGLNIDFGELFTHFNPHIYFGGDSVVFWGPLAWTMIYGLGFATVITLILVPVMMLLSFRLKAWLKRKYNIGKGVVVGSGDEHEE